MELTVFLEKQDIRKIGLFKFLEASYQQRATFSDISENLNISDFILLNTVDELTRDIEANQLTDCFKLEKTEKHIILKKSGKASVQVLAWLYLKKSHSFKILDEIKTKGTSKERMRKAGQYCVQIYGDFFGKLNGADMLQLVSEDIQDFYELVSMDQYSEDYGLDYAMDNGIAIFV